MERTRPFVSVIVPVLDDESGLEDLLVHLFDQTLCDGQYEIVVVDNGSAPPLTSRLFDDERVRAIYRPGGGSNAARNEGITIANGSIFAFTDADCEPAPSWLEEGIRCLERSNAQRMAGRIEFTFDRDDGKSVVELYDSITHLNQESYVRHLSFGATANLFVRSSLFDVVGPFSQEVKFGGDFEWGLRAHRAGYTIEYCPEAVVKHPARRSLRALLSKELRVARTQEYLRTRTDRIESRPFWREAVIPFRRLCSAVHHLGDSMRFRQILPFSLLFILIHFLHLYVQLVTGPKAPRSPQPETVEDVHP